jgi:hypothetical protein
MNAAATASTQTALFATNARKRISSLLKKPENGKMPAIASVPSIIVTKVTGRYFFRPPIRRMSCSPPMA